MQNQDQERKNKIQYEIEVQGSWFICLIKESGKSQLISYKPQWFPTEKSAKAFGELIKFRYSK